MQIVATSSVESYADKFWARERHKLNGADRYGHFRQLDNGADPVDMIRKFYAYKLPFNGNPAEIKCALMHDDDLSSLQVFSRIVNDEWMRHWDLVPELHTNKINELAEIFLKRGFFAKDPAETSGTAHGKNYHAWKASARDSDLKGVLDEDAPLCQLEDNGEVTVVDGWGRLAPLLALRLEGFDVAPVRCYVAFQK